MSLLRIVEGLITIRRPKKPLPYSYFEGSYAPAVNQLFDFGKVCQDIYVHTSANLVLRFDSTANDPIVINPKSGVKFTRQWAGKVYATFTQSPTTHMVLLANG